MNIKNELKEASKILKKSKKKNGELRGLNEWDQGFLSNIIKWKQITKKQLVVLNRIKFKYYINKELRKNEKRMDCKPDIPSCYSMGSGGYTLDGLDHDDLDQWCDGPEY